MEVKAGPTPQEINKPVAPKEGFAPKAKLTEGLARIKSFISKPSTQEDPDSAIQALAQGLPPENNSNVSENSTDSAELKQANKLLETFVNIRDALAQLKDRELFFPLVAAATSTIVALVGDANLGLAAEAAFTGVSSMGGNFKDAIKNVGKAVGGFAATQGLDNLPVAEAGVAIGYAATYKDAAIGIGKEVLNHEVTQNALQFARKAIPQRGDVRPPISVA